MTESPDLRHEGDDLLGALDLLVDHCRDNEAVLPQIEAVGRFFATGARTAIPKCAAGWPELIGRVGALAYLSAAPGTEAAVRTEILRLLGAWSETPFVEGVERYRYVVCDLAREDVPFPLERPTKWEQDAWGAGEDGGHRWFVNGFVRDEPAGRGIRVLEFAPGGNFRDLPWSNLIREVRFAGPGWATAPKLQRFARVVAAQGPFAFERTHAGDLAARTGMSPAEAALLLAGFPRLRETDRDFLGAEFRERHGLDVAAAAAARDAWLARESSERRDVLDGALPEDAEFLYDPTALVPRLAASCQAVLGKRLSVPPELLGRLDSDVGFVDGPNAMVSMLTDPAGSPRLNGDGSWVLLENGVVARAGGDGGEEVFDGNALVSIAVYLPYLYAETASGHPLRAKLPEVLLRVRRRIAHAGFLLGGLRFDPGKNKNAVMAELLAGSAYRIPDAVRSKRVLGRDTGDLVALLDLAGGDVSVAYRPGRVDGWDRVRRFEVEAPHHGIPASIAAEFLLSDGCQRICDRIERGGLAEGAWEANPLASAPDLVREVAGELGLEEDAAVLYLQLLALPAPTTRSVREANGWPKKRFEAAGEALLARELVVEEKRPRAGRELFVPGPWEALPRPNAPMEGSKLPLYGATRDAKGRIVLPLRRAVPLVPLPEIFAQAWSRSRQESTAG